MAQTNFKGEDHYRKVKVKSRPHYDIVHLPSINILHLIISELSPGEKFTDQGHYNKVKGQTKVSSWHCKPTPPASFPTKYQHPTSHGFWDTAQTSFFPPPTLPSGRHGKNNTRTALEGFGVKLLKFSRACENFQWGNTIQFHSISWKFLCMYVWLLVCIRPWTPLMQNWHQFWYFYLI